MRLSASIILIAGASLMASCGHGPGTVADPDPADKIPAIEKAVRQKDRRVIPQLVIDLENDDPAVRLYVIRALHDLTGQDFGYRYYGDADERKPAVEKWKEWLAKHP